MFRQTAALLTVSAVLPTAATVAVLLRVLARSKKKVTNAPITASEYLIFASLVSETFP